MNPHLESLQPYPFQRLAKLKADSQTTSDEPHIGLSIGEPKHRAPAFVGEVMAQNLASLSKYPPTKGSAELRQAIADWLTMRYLLPEDMVDPEQHVLPVNGTREALFAIAQCVVDAAEQPVVMMPNPFYQIYEGAALLAGAEPYFLNCLVENDFIADLAEVPDDVWKRCQLVYLCSPANPSGAVLSKIYFEALLEKADRYDFVIASDECYSEIYFTEPPLGLLQICAALGRTDFKRCIVFNSLSKRSNLPGLRSGFVAGDAELMAAFLLYRTYHGGAMPPITQAVSVAAWQDEQHVGANRELYQEKFAAVLGILQPVWAVNRPEAGFFLWPHTPVSDIEFAQQLFTRQNVTVLPGSFLARDAHGINPGKDYVRMALVAPYNDCVLAAERVAEFIKTL